MGSDMKKDFLLVGNFKNNMVDAKQYQSNLGDMEQKMVILCPNFCQIESFESLRQKGIRLGAQDVSQFENGSHTGEISVDALTKNHIEFCIVGHSERRNDFAESDNLINQKLKLLQKTEIIPILCVGEGVSDSMPQIEWAKQTVFEQLSAELKNVDQAKLIVAYEPVWAIGTGKVADNQHISEICAYIKKTFDIKTILYGGSVNQDNLKEIYKIDFVDGVLVGKASLDAKNMVAMQQKICNEQFNIDN